MGWTRIGMNAPYGMRHVREILEREIPGVKIVNVKYGTAWGIVTKEGLDAGQWGDRTGRPNLENLIICILWKYSRGEFMYKEMSEDMEPFYYNIPLKWINLSCDVAKKEWRNKVRQHHCQEKILNREIRKMKPGDTIKYNGNRTFIFSKMRRTMVLAYEAGGGVLYRLTRKNIESIIAA